MDQRPRDILRDNLKSLMAAHPDRDTIVKVSLASKVSKGVVERMTKAEANTGVDHLQGIAEAFDIELWQLFVPGLDPGNLPVLRNASQTEEGLYKRIKALVEEREKLNMEKSK